MKKLLQKLEERKKEGNLRSLSVHNNLIDFFSNDYLGLARNKELAALIHQKHTDIPGNLNGATVSRLLSGNSEYFEETERKLAGVFKAEKCLIFNSGYNANLSILSSVPQKGDTIIYDELIHASLKEGARLSFASRFPFKHNDLYDLEQKIKKAQGDCYVVVESVYSMDGDCSPLKEIIQLCEKHGAFLILDEAHTTGIWGKGGNGLACETGLYNNIFARIYTFGKAMGIHGACIAGSSSLIEYLINFARPFIYTTALPPHSLSSIQAAFDFIKANNKISDSLFQRIALFKNQCKNILQDQSLLIESESPIQVFKASGNKNANDMADFLSQKGFDVRAILSPTVKEGEERLRICLHVYNTEEEIKKLVECIKNSQL
ncbi:MAG: 8-amino-7-oxononanoate synthase [Cytophagaceae bacterium]|nr:8-amino-7-oxononanoate synthase [Cytophagaceae bacterium]